MVRSIGFVGIRTAAFGEMTGLYRDILGLQQIHESPRAAWFKAADGTPIHIYATGDPDHDFFGAAPVVGLVVDDFEATRSALLAAGIPFIGEPQRDGGIAWNHYRAPDGNVYEIIGPDRGAA